MDVRVAPLEQSQLREASAMLARAFDDDPVPRHLWPGSRVRKLASRAAFRSIVGLTLTAGEPYAALDDDGAVVGIGAWVPPTTQEPPHLWQRLRVIAGSAPALLHPSTVLDGMRFVREVEKRRPRNEHWYLAVLGVEPAWQGRGVGSALLAAVLDRADSEAQPAYLETAKESNVAFYRRSRFDVTEEFHPIEGGPVLWTMWRPAAEA